MNAPGQARATSEIIQILKQILPDKEFRRFMKLRFDELSQAELAREEKVSQQAISKSWRRISKILESDTRLKELLR